MGCCCAAGGAPAEAQSGTAGAGTKGLGGVRGECAESLPGALGDGKRCLIAWDRGLDILLIARWRRHGGERWLWSVTITASRHLLRVGTAWPVFHGILLASPSTILVAV